MYSFLELVEQLEQRLSASPLFPETPANLYEPCNYLVRLGGKRIRPVLCLMGNELFGTLQEDAWHAAVGIELFHNFTLIHDDIMDKAPLRRGQPTIHEKYGLTTGILGGDVMSIFAYTHLAQVRSHLPAVLHLFNKTAIEVCEGQQLDMDYEQRQDVSMDEYLRMIELKTSVLLAASLKMGAIIGGATGGNADKLYAFGKNLGIAFQLQDDYLDAFGDTAVIGKQNGGDIKSNKKTYLLIKALERGSKSQKTELEGWLTRDAPEKVGAVSDLYRSAGADTECLEAVRRYSDLAFESLDRVAVISHRKQRLLELASFLLKRQS